MPMSVTTATPAVGLTTSRRCRHPVVGSHELYSNRINQMTYICDTRALEGDSLQSEPAMLSLKRGKTRCRVPRLTRSAAPSTRIPANPKNSCGLTPLPSCRWKLRARRIENPPVCPRRNARVGMPRLNSVLRSPYSTPADSPHAPRVKTRLLRRRNSTTA